MSLITHEKVSSNTHEGSSHSFFCPNVTANVYPTSLAEMGLYCWKQASHHAIKSCVNHWPTQNWIATSEIKPLNSSLSTRLLGTPVQANKSTSFLDICFCLSLLLSYFFLDSSDWWKVSCWCEKNEGGFLCWVVCVAFFFSYTSFNCEEWCFLRWFLRFVVNFPFTELLHFQSIIIWYNTNTHILFFIILKVVQHYCVDDQEIYWR